MSKADKILLEVSQIVHSKQGHRCFRKFHFLRKLRLEFNLTKRLKILSNFTIKWNFICKYLDLQWYQWAEFDCFQSQQHKYFLCHHHRHHMDSWIKQDLKDHQGIHILHQQVSRHNLKFIIEYILSRMIFLNL